VLLQPGDVITVLHQPNSLMLLGATTKNEELNFEAQGITLAQALARAGGLQDQRANPEAVFIFRFEEPAVSARRRRPAPPPMARVPVIYRVNLRDPFQLLHGAGLPDAQQGHPVRVQRAGRRTPEVLEHRRFRRWTHLHDPCAE
jgi:polysaccharide export outer membrane protein